jgi:nickel/cobalt exporter
MGLESILQNGTTPLLLLFPAALLLGALHGLEPGHAKGLMAAFVVAVRGTPQQAVLLGLSAALSHTLIVWLLALAGLAWGQHLLNGDGHAYFVLASGIMVFAAGVWTASRTWLFRPRRVAHPPHDDHHHPAHGNDHHHQIQ